MGSKICFEGELMMDSDLVNQFKAQPSVKGKVLKVSPNGRYFEFSDGKPLLLPGGHRMGAV